MGCIFCIFRYVLYLRCTPQPCKPRSIQTYIIGWRHEASEYNKSLINFRYLTREVRHCWPTRRSRARWRRRPPRRGATRGERPRGIKSTGLHSWKHFTTLPLRRIEDGGISLQKKSNSVTNRSHFVTDYFPTNVTISSYHCNYTYTYTVEQYVLHVICSIHDFVWSDLPLPSVYFVWCLPPVLIHKGWREDHF